MTARLEPNTRYPAYDRARRIQDFSIVSSFALWAALLGFGPIVTYRILLG